MSEIRRLIGVGLFGAVVIVVGFLVWVELTSSFDTTPVFFAPVLVGAVVGLVLSVRVPENSIGVVVLIATLSMTGLGAGEVVQDWGLANGYQTLAIVASLVNDTSWAALFVSVLILLPIWFPDGLAIHIWSKWVARSAIVLTTLAIAGFWLADEVCVSYPGESCLRYEPSPWGIPNWDGTILEPLLAVAFLLSIPAAISAILRWRRSIGVVRQQLKWFVFAVSLLILGGLLSLAGLSQTLNDLVAVLLLSGVWVAIGVAVLRYRLYDIDRFISRTLSYTLVVAVLGVVYLGVITLVTSLVPSQDSIAVAGSTLAVAALFNPVRKRIQRAVDRRFNRSGYQVDVISEQFAAKLQASLNVNEIAEAWTDTVTAALQPEGTGIWLKRS